MRFCQQALDIVHVVPVTNPNHAVSTDIATPLAEVIAMFEMSLVESSGALKSRSSRYMWITGAFNAVLVAVMILIPLLYPETLPRMALTGTLMAPPLPRSAAPPRAEAARVANTVAHLDPFTAPNSIPHTIDARHDDAPPPSLGTGVVGMTDTVGSGALGPAGSIGLDAPPPVVKVTPQKLVAPMHISSGVIAGNKLSGSNPVYPPIARAAHVSGAVVLHAIISRAGAIQSLSVVSGNEMLRANALSAVQDWRYRPYLLNGEPTEVETTITVNFLIGG